MFEGGKKGRGLSKMAIQMKKAKLLGGTKSGHPLNTYLNKGIKELFRKLKIVVGRC
jgi:hypothetical protein